MFIKFLLKCMSVFFFLVALGSGCSDKTETINLFDKNIKKGKLEPVTLTFYFPSSWGDRHAYIEDVIGAIEKKSRKELNCSLDFKFISFFTYQEDIKEIVASGKPCDAYITFIYEHFDILENMNNEGYALDITTLLPRYAPKYNNKLEKEALASMTIDGRILGIRNNYPESGKICALVRDDLMGKYSISPIKSLDDFEAFLDTLKQNEGDMIVLTVTQSILYIFAPAYGYAILNPELNLVYKWNDPEMKVMPWEQTPEYRKAVERVYSWYKKGYVLKDYIGMWTSVDDVFIRSRKFGTSIGRRGDVSYFNRVLYENEADWRYLEYPLFPDAVCQRMMYDPAGIVISSKSENPERVLMFLEWIHEKQENYDLITYGIKNKHYFLKGDQYVFPEGITHNTSFYNWQQHLWVFSDIDFERVHISNSKKYRNEILKNIPIEAPYPPHGNIRIDYSGIETTMRKRSQFEMEWIVQKGEYTQNTINNFIVEQKELGIDKIVAYTQARLDEIREQQDTEI